MMKLTVKNAKCSVRFRKFLGGSVLKGTVYNRWDGVDTHLSVECDAPADKLAHLLKNANPNGKASNRSASPPTERAFLCRKMMDLAPPR